jgi:hypothetical protein
MPSTPTYGFPYEDPADQPGISITGGPLGTEDILAEAVEAEVERIDNTVTDHESRLALLEAGTSMVGWVPVQAGSSSGASFDIDLTDGGRFSAGEFALVRLHMRFDLDTTGGVLARINNDTGGNVYVYGARTLDATNPADPIAISSTPFNLTRAALGVDQLIHQDGVSAWQIGWGGTVSSNVLEAEFFHMNGNNLHAFMSRSVRQSTSATTHAESTHWGFLPSALSAAPSSIRILPGSGATNIEQAWWWAEGFRVP